jgi:signal peptidase I
MGLCSMASQVDTPGWLPLGARGCDSQSMKRAVSAAIALLALGGALLTGRLLRRYAVEGRSMLRAYAPGDRLLVEGLSYRLRKPRIGEAVVVRQPGGSARLDLKRIAAGPGAEVMVNGQPDFLGNDEWYVLGDNLGESTDSRELGPVRTKDIVGRVWRRY